MTIEQPANLDAERAVLGSVFLNRDAMTPIAPWLRADDFYLARHQQIFAAMLACYANRTPPDVRLVADTLKAAAQLEGIGGVTYLTELIHSVPSSYHVEFYAKAVQRDAIKRRIIAAGGKIAALGYDSELDADAVQSQAQALLTATAPTQQRGGFASVGTVLNELEDAPTRANGLLTGIHDLDRLLGGLYPGNLCLLAGIPGSGKTTLATQIAYEYARMHGPAALVSLEMTRAEVTQRLISYQTGISTQHQRANTLSEDDETLLMRAKVRMAETPLYIEDASGLSAGDIRLRVLRLLHEVGSLGVLVIDYLGLLAMPTSRTATLSQQMNSAAQSLKDLGKEIGAPVLLCAQLNREIFKRRNQIPLLSDLREAGEAPADQVLVTMRPELFDADDRPGEAELYLVKHRHGPTGMAPAQFDGARYRFRNPAPKYRTYDGYQYEAA